MTNEPTRSTDRLSEYLTVSMISFAIMGVSGIVLNLIIGWYWNATALGIFNQVFAFYIFFSQLAVLGLHNAALTYVAAEGNPVIIAKIARAGLSTVLGVSLGASILFPLSAVPFSILLDSPVLAEGVWWATPGLFLFALNKYFLALLNGQQRMIEFFILQSFRYIALVGAVAVQMPSGDAAIPRLPVAFSIAELLVFIPAVMLVRPLIFTVDPASSGWAEHFSWSRRLFFFGTRSVMANVISELNTRVDILMLGVFVSDAIVGIYSFVAVLAEGLYQAAVVIRTIFAPRVVAALHAMNLADLDQIIRRGMIISYCLLALGGVVGISLYPWAIDFVGLGSDFKTAWGMFSILIIGISIGAGYTPFNQILIWGKRPGSHSLYIASVLLVNMAGNLVLIPLYGGIGAAVATATAYAYASLMVPITAKRILGINIFWPFCKPIIKTGNDRE